MCQLNNSLFHLGLRAGTARDGQNLEIKDLSVAFIRVADRDAIIERHEKGVRIPVKTRTLSAMSV